VRQLLLVLISLALSAPLLSAAQVSKAPTGELQVKVIGYETEEPLPGANVTVLRTDLRAIADQSGTFAFRNLAEGVYELEVSLIGYLKAKRTRVEVRAGQTTQLLIRLRSSPIILEKGVRVVGERPMLDIRLPATSRELTPRELELVPVTDLKEIISQQVGVIQDKTELHIRGGRSYENLFLIDGLLVNDPFTRSGYGIAISPTAIERINLISGGAGTQYGQATAGVVEMEIKEGGRNFEGSFAYKTDELGFSSPSSFNTDVMDLSLSGPAEVLQSALSRLGLKIPGDFYFFFNANVNLSDTHLRHPENLFSSSFGDARFAPREDNRFFGVFKLTWKNPTLKCSFTSGKSVVINQDKSVLLTRLDLATESYGPPFSYSELLGSYNTFTHESNFQILSLRQIVGEKNLFSASLSRLFTNLHSDVNGKNWREYAMPVDAYPFEIELSPDSTHYVVIRGPDGFYDQGDGDTWYDHFIETYGMDLKLMRAMSNVYTLQAGISERYQTIQLLDIYKPWLGAQGWGLSHDLYRVHANDGALFLENHLKLEQATLSFGLRYDFWFPGKYVERAMQDTGLHFITPEMREEFQENTFEVLGHRGKANLNPRLGFSAPLGKGTSFFFNYGRLSRRPNPQYLYARLYSGGESSYQLLGNPNLNSERVASYEVGVKSMLSDDDALSLVGYYRSIFDYITAARLVPDTLRPENVYLVYFNLDFATSRGLEIEYKRRVGDFFSGSVQLGFSKTIGERSDPEDILKGIGGRSVQQLYQEHVFDWDKPWQVVVKTRFSSDETELRLFGLKLPREWDLNLNFWAHAGQRYTPYRQVISSEDQIEYVQSGETNSRIGRLWSSLDVVFRKHFYWRDFKYSLLLEATNLLDHKNVVIVNPLTGDAYQKDDVIPYAHGDPDLPDKSRKLPLWSDPSRFLAPRQVKVGISVRW
jgi:outer membrane receptor protein involved in Fe transport